MKTLKTVPGQNLVLGHRGENLATRIIFSIAPWVETYGPGTAHLLHQRQGDSEPYPVATLQEGTEVSWDVTDGDTALEGYGKYELRYYVAETLVKSSVGETYHLARYDPASGTCLVHHYRIGFHPGECSEAGCQSPCMAYEDPGGVPEGGGEYGRNCHRCGKAD